MEGDMLSISSPFFSFQPLLCQFAFNKRGIFIASGAPIIKCCTVNEAAVVKRRSAAMAAAGGEAAALSCFSFSKFHVWARSNSASSVKNRHA